MVRTEAQNLPTRPAPLLAEFSLSGNEDPLLRHSRLHPWAEGGGEGKETEDTFRVIILESRAKGGRQAAEALRWQQGVRELLADETVMPAEGSPWSPDPTSQREQSCCEMASLITADALPPSRKTSRLLIISGPDAPILAVHWKGKFS